MSDQAAKRLKRINELTQQIDTLQRELESLLLPEKKVVTPSSFDVYGEVMKIVLAAGHTGVSSDSVVNSLKTTFPEYGLTNKKITNVLNYLKTRRGTVESIGYGKYRATTKTTGETESSGG